MNPSGWWLFPNPADPGTLLSLYRVGLVSLLQAVGLVGYCGVVAWVMLNLPRLFGLFGPSVGAIAFLLVLFVVSAVISASSVLAYPAYLIISGRLIDGARILACTVGWLAVFLLVAGFSFFLAG